MTETKRAKRHSKASKKRTTQPSLTHLFAARLREVRTLKQLTLDDVVELGGGGSGGRLSLLERGTVSPTLRTVEELARALEVDPIDLLIDPQINERHRLIAGTSEAEPAELGAAIAALERRLHDAPTARLARQRTSALPPWAQDAVLHAARALLRNADTGLADALLDLTDPQLRMITAVIDALDRIDGPLDHQAPEARPVRRIDAQVQAVSLLTAPPERLR